MSSEARSAQVVELAKWRKDGATIEQLEALLADAKKGKISGILVAAQYDDGETAYVGSGCYCSNPMLGVSVAHELANKLLRR